MPKKGLSWHQGLEGMYDRQELWVNPNTVRKGPLNPRTAGIRPHNLIPVPPRKAKEAMVGPTDPEAGQLQGHLDEAV